MGNDLPMEPLTELAAGAVQLHEMYESFIQGGFNEAQAMQLICAVVAASVTNN